MNVLVEVVKFNQYSVRESLDIIVGGVKGNDAVKSVYIYLRRPFLRVTW